MNKTKNCGSKRITILKQKFLNTAVHWFEGSVIILLIEIVMLSQFNLSFLVIIKISSPVFISLFAACVCVNENLFHLEFDFLLL